MATIEKRKNKDSTFSYRLVIRKKNHPEIYKTFHTEEDANIYAFYKERLIDNMNAFEVPLEERVTLKQILEIKLNESNNLNKRTVLDLNNSFNMISDFINPNRFVSTISKSEWEKLAKDLLQRDVYKGAKTEDAKRKMSISTLRRHFACYSSAFSMAMGKGLKIENNPMLILTSFINPLMKENKKVLQHI